MDIHTTLYDTWQPSTTANAETVLFQTPQGGDSTHTEQFTNSRGAGQLPANEKFTIRKIHLIKDKEMAQADFDTLLYNSFIQIKINDKIRFAAPSHLLYSASSHGGAMTQASAALINAIGLQGSGFALDIPIVVDGGQRFQVRCVQGAAFAGATDHKVALEGVLSVPD